MKWHEQSYIRAPKSSVTRAFVRMNRYLLASFLFALLVFPMTVSAVTYAPSTFADDGVQVDVEIESPERWNAPFEEDVNVTLGITPQASVYVNISVTQVVVALQEQEADGSYTLLAADSYSPPSPVTGIDHVNLTHEFVLTGSGNGLECYFSLTVVGYYYNETGITPFSASSPNDLVGPLTVIPGISSPQSLVGIVVIAAFVVVFVLGAYGVKKSRSTYRGRDSLTDQ